ILHGVRREGRGPLFDQAHPRPKGGTTSPPKRNLILGHDRQPRYKGGCAAEFPSAYSPLARRPLGFDFQVRESGRSLTLARGHVIASDRHG
ncbi:MAG TPA: hypothetical protein VJO35_14465, partial [Terriglobales bacterium]|nr:hypothetical protein [Terriglobales bacterium]